MPILRLFFLLTLVALIGCNQESDYKKIIGSTMGTNYSVIAKISGQDIHQIHQKIEAELKDINQLMSTYIADSEINQFNKLTDNSCFKFSHKSWHVLLASKQIYEETDGAFDITLGPLISRWGFSAEEYEQKVPTHEEITQLLASTGTDKLQFNEQQQCISKAFPSMTINLSAIAKGYAVDQLAAILDDYRINSYLIEIGGEVKAKGLKSNDQNWKIAVEKPSRNLHRQQSIIVNLIDISIATSGDYRNYFEHKGKRFSHTINPKTGYPISHNLSSISVLHPSNMMADAYATALNVMGADAAYKFADTHQLAIYTIQQKNGKAIAQQNNLFRAYISQ